MKKEKVPTLVKINQTFLKSLPLLKKGEKRTAYHGLDSRMLAIPNQRNIALVVSLNKNNRRPYETLGYYPDMTAAEFESAATNFIANVVNRGHSKSSTIKVKDFYESHVKPFSLANHKDSAGFLQRLKPFLEKFGHIRISEVTKSDIQKLLITLSKGRSSSTVARYLAAISKFFSLAMEQE